MSSIKITNISNRNGDSGAIISGISTASGTGYAKLPSGSAAQRVGIESGSLRYNSDTNEMEFYNGTSWATIINTTRLINARGIFGGGVLIPSGSTNTIDYITISTTGNATDFGDLTSGTTYYGTCSSSTRGVFGGGTSRTQMEYIEFATTGNTVNFGSFAYTSQFREQLAGCSSSTRGIFGGGYAPSPVATRFNIIEYITIATTGNATDFGDLTQARHALSSCSSSTRGLFGGGYNTPTTYNIIDYVTIASTGNATDFGDLTSTRKNLAACSSSTRGVFGGGGNVIDYVTIASTGNATDFGDLNTNSNALGACSSSTRGVFGGGDPGGNVIDYITIATTGNATDFGDLLNGKYRLSATSNAHGGLS